MTQQDTKWGTKNTFFQIQGNLTLPAPVKHEPQLLNVVVQQPEHSQIIKIDFQEFMNKLPKSCDNHSRED